MNNLRRPRIAFTLLVTEKQLEETKRGWFVPWTGAKLRTAEMIVCVLQPSTRRGRRGADEQETAPMLPTASSRN